MVDLGDAERGIRELHSHYTDAVFRQDARAFAECFVQNGEWRISGRVFRGSAEIEAAITTILDKFDRVLITFRTPILAEVDGVIGGRTYIDEKCAWKNGNRNVSIGRYYERFAQEDGRWRFSWRLFQLVYRGDPDLSGTFFDCPDFGPPPGMPPLDATTEDIASTRWGLAPG